MLPHRFKTLENWQFELLARLETIQHLSTGKNAHFNSDIGGFNFSWNVTDHPDKVLENRNLIAEMLLQPAQKAIIPKQTHSDHIGVVTQLTLSDTWENTDALITNVPHTIIGVLSADCVPVLLADPIQGVVAAIHAGWRGTAKEIVPKTIRKMVEFFQCKPEDVRAGIGPSISSDCYEVGEEVAAHFRTSSKTNRSSGKACIDLWKENETQLLQAGIKQNHIELAGLCTFSNPDLFYSARRDGLQTGRMASFIVVNKH